MRAAPLTCLLLSLCLSASAASSSKPASRTTDSERELDTMLSNAPATGQAIEAAGSGVHREKDKNISASAAARSGDGQAGAAASGEQSSGAAGADTKTATTDGKGELVDPALAKKTKLGGKPAATGAARPGVKILDAFIDITTLHTYDSLRAMPEHQGAHGIARVGGPGEAWAVGMMTYSAAEFAQLSKNTGRPAQAMSGHCWGGYSPRVNVDTGCEWNMWVSATPGGDPVGPHCAVHAVVMGDASTAVVNWYNPAPGHEADGDKSAGTYMCKLTGLDTRYYCNFAATGWDSKYQPKHCDILYTGPLSYSAADNPPAN